MFSLIGLLFNLPYRKGFRAWWAELWPPAPAPGPPVESGPEEDFNHYSGW